MCPVDYDDDEILFADYDGSDDEESGPVASRTWQLLIVDDDHEIHSVTKLALSDLHVFDGDLQFLHAYSGSEAIELMSKPNDIAVILLDVVMETEDAGLRVAKYIRDELQLHDVRIVLRTGQPGYAPEESIVKEYDINDYKTKTELTRSRLVTTIVSSIRSYQQIITINESKTGLEQVLNASAHLMEKQSLNAFSIAAITKLSQILGLQEDGVLCARLDHGADAKQSDMIKIIGAAGRYQNLIGKKLIDCDNGRLINQVTMTLGQQEHIVNEHDTALLIKGNGHTACFYFDDGKKEFSDVELQLQEVFLANVAVGFENVNLLHQLRNAAYRDPLTNLPNRTDFIRQLDKFTRGRILGDVVALIDLEHFSDINDGLGQEIGNDLINAVSYRLLEILDQNCSLSRIGADVFGIIGHDLIVNPSKLEEVFSLPFKASDHYLPVSATIGMVRKNDCQGNGIDVLKQVYIALNKAKKNSKEKFAYYAADMEHQTAWRLGMIRKLRTDFANRRLQVWFQPQLDLNTKKVIGMEALCRWPSEDGTYVSPAVFIPLAEYSGLIVDIGAWVIEESCRQLKQLESLGMEKLRISVNVSMPQFRSETFVQDIVSTVNTFNIEASRLELEITESVVMDDPQVVIDSLEEIKEKGIQVAIDDFGTGFSSLSYLQKLPLDRIKVDRAFVRDMHNKSGSIIAETIIELGKRLGLATIAEGVETEEQEAHLRKLGCEEVQGFLYAKPMPAKALQQLLIAQKKS